MVKLSSLVISRALLMGNGPLTVDSFARGGVPLKCFIKMFSLFVFADFGGLLMNF